ncbi:MAG: regulatory protein TetR [Labilithrix sp.]|nr:regulatory protein TetR [Labilithrix sp.]
MSRVADPTARSALLRAAEDVFAERGVIGAKVEEITRRAGLSKGAFYLHFESKETILRQIVEAWLVRCGTFFAAPGEYPDAPVDPDSILDFCIQRDVQLYEYIWASRTTMRILVSCQGEHLYMFETFREEMRRRNRAWLEQWRQDGLIRAEIEIELAATLMSGAYEELANRVIRSDDRPAFEEWLGFAQETFVRGFGTPELLGALERRNQRSAGIHHVRGRTARDGVLGLYGTVTSRVQLRGRG